MVVGQAVDRAAGVTDRAAAYAALTDLHLADAYRLATAILGDALEAEDAVHDAALIAWRRWDQLRNPDRFEAWFDRILVNGCRDRLRRRRRRAVVELDVAGDPPEPAGTTDEAARTVSRIVLDRAVAELDPDHAVVVALRFGRDLPVAEIAARLGVPEGTVKSRLHHALLRLRAALDDGEAES